MKAITALPNRKTTKETVHIGKRKDFGRRLCELDELTARRAYEIFERKGKTHGHDREDWFEAQSELFAPLPGEFAEGEFSLEWKAEVGRFHARDLEVHVEPNRLVILGRRVAPAVRHENEVRFPEGEKKEIFRVVDLPVEVDPVMVTANIQNGVLGIFLLKAAIPRDRAGQAAAA